MKKSINPLEVLELESFQTQLLSKGSISQDVAKDDSIIINAEFYTNFESELFLFSEVHPFKSIFDIESYVILHDVNKIVSQTSGVQTIPVNIIDYPILGNIVCDEPTKILFDSESIKIGDNSYKTRQDILFIQKKGRMQRTCIGISNQYDLDEKDDFDEVFEPTIKSNDISDVLRDLLSFQTSSLSSSSFYKGHVMKPLGVTLRNYHENLSSFASLQLQYFLQTSTPLANENFVVIPLKQKLNCLSKIRASESVSFDTSYNLSGLDNDSQIFDSRTMIYHGSKNKPEILLQPKSKYLRTLTRF